MNKESLQGYILEEALAYLLRKTGYSLLVDESQDPLELKNGRNGLLVRGRGSNHQVDVLGEFNITPAFMYPLRLFIEAKYKVQKVGIGTVRSAIGVLHDINQNYIASGSKLVKRYSYSSAIFSANGFTQGAIDLAIAHGISLIDIRDCGLESLLIAISRVADDLVNRYGEEISEINQNKRFYKDIRIWMRHVLGTSPYHYFRDGNYFSINVEDIFEEFLYEVRSIDELLISSIGPFIIVMKPDEIADFNTYVSDYPKHEVNINWSTAEGNGQIWRVTPKYEDGYLLKFRLPSSLAEYFYEGDNMINRALDIKGQYMSQIIIYRELEMQDQLIRLQYKR